MLHSGYHFCRISRFRLQGMKFIVPLKRSDKSIDCVPVMAGGISGMEGHFSFEGRNIWYYTRDVDGRKMYVYLDTRLREKESDDCFFNLSNKQAV